MQSIRCTNGSENMPNNRSVSENMSDNNAASNDVSANAIKSPRIVQSCDEDDNQVAVQFSWFPTRPSF